jgi:PadR family transcriptional regulator PadR
MKRIYLGEFEELVLLVTATLDGDAYSVLIAHQIIKQAGRRVRLNQVHNALQRLEEKGLVSSRMGEPTSERGGRRKRLFKITAFGKQALRDGQSVRKRLWDLLPASVKLSQA